MIHLPYIAFLKVIFNLFITICSFIFRQLRLVSKKMEIPVPN